MIQTVLHFKPGRLFLYAVICLLLWLCSLAYGIVTFPQASTVGRADAAIVLGAAVWDDKPSPVFKSRIDHAIQLYQQKMINKIIFTGGIGDGKKYPESVVARMYAIEHGVVANDILIETRSRTTIQNLHEAQRLMQSRAIDTVLLVSDPLHMKRSMRIATDMGIKAQASPTTTSRYSGIYKKARFVLWELYFYQRYLLTGK